jgi:class 3 adenylate cyclase
MYNSLGRVALERGEREAAARPAAARRLWEKAAGWLDGAILRSQEHQWSVMEGFARKDRALVHLAEDQLPQAEDQARQAEELFRGQSFREGLAHVQRVRGILRRRHSDFAEAQKALRAALRYFDEAKERVEAVRCLFEMARTHRAAGDPPPLVSQALLAALKRAEECNRAELVRQIEEELKEVDAHAHCTHVYQRVRGRVISEDTTSLLSGSRETVTLLYLDLQGSTAFALERDPQDVMLTINQMMAGLMAVLRRHEVQVSVFRGDGFLALVRGSDHAGRAVTAALELYDALAAFNKPREVLKLPLFVARIGISTGQVFLGNVGTYDKMDFTALGATANLGARLEAEAEPGLPCISRQTHADVCKRFHFRKGNPRRKELKGIGEQELWDVTGRREA